MPRQLECLLLKTIRFGEQGYILKLLTSEGEQLDAVLTISSKSKSAKRAFLHPLSALNLVLSDKKSNGLPYASQFSFQMGRSLIQAGPPQLALALFFSEVFFRITQWQKGDSALYNLAMEYVERMLKPENSACLPLQFLLEIIDWSGFLPEPPQKSTPNLVFGLQSATFSPEPGSGLEPVFSPHLTQIWINLLVNKAVPESATQRRELLDAMVRFLEWHFDRHGSIQSHRIFAEMNQS
jgi:recombinational DNA repair protein (RecF pathway)